MKRIDRGFDTTGAGTARQFCIAGLFSLLFLLATGTCALAVDCTICHYPGGMGPMPHDPVCQETSCLQSCHPKDYNRHPTGPRTPLPLGGDRTTSCRTCHDKPFPGVYHPYTINVSAGSITPPGAVDLDQACGQCHGGGTSWETNPPQPGISYFNKTVLGNFAGDIHQSMPVARFTFSYDAATSYKVNFDAGSSTCPSSTCTYEWDFTSDGTNDAAGITASNTYGGETSQTVKLTVTDPVSDVGHPLVATQSQTVTPRYVNQPPVAAFTLGFEPNTWVATITNTSTDENVAGVNFYITWGDGTSDPVRTGLTNPTFTHTYTSAGTFTITLRATDSAGLSSTATNSVSPAAFTIPVLVTAGPAGASNVNSVLLTLKKGTTILANTYTAASGPGPFSYNFTGLAPATNYTVTATKTGAVFAEANPTANKTVGPNAATQTFTTVKTRFMITSTARRSTGSPLSGVTITVRNSAGTTVATGTTNSSGVYATNMTLAAGTYTVSASMTGRVFSNTPQSITFANGGADGALTFNSTTP